jgi:hypothetical protein
LQSVSFRKAFFCSGTVIGAFIGVVGHNWLPDQCLIPYQQ